MYICVCVVMNKMKNNINNTITNKNYSCLGLSSDACVLSELPVSFFPSP